MDTYEKKYKEALERARVWKEKSGMPKNKQGILDDIFPELKESEDEKIRKLLVEAVTQVLQDQYCSNRGVSKEKVVAWLEKQESVNEIVSRCRTSWYNEGKIAGMAEGLTDDEKYQQGWHDALEKQDECHISHDDEIMIKQLTEYFTTGHGLQNTNEIVVEWLNDVKEKLEKQGEVESDNDDIEVEEKGIREAFNKIEDEKQCKQKPQRMVSAEAKEAMYDKSNWSEEDEKMLKSIISDYDDMVNESEGFAPFCNKRNWLKSLKARYIWKPSDEQKPTWSEEDEKMLADACIMLDWYQGNNWWKAQHIKNWLKSLKQRIGG